MLLLLANGASPSTDGNAAGSLPSISIASANGVASGDGYAAGTFASVSLAAPSGSASGGSSADVKVSWLQLDTNATPCDVKVSWLQLDSNVPQLGFASLGGAPERLKRKPIPEEADEITEAISAAEITRIRNEFLSESLAHDLITRARKRKSRAEEEALLLIL